MIILHSQWDKKKDCFYFQTECQHEKYGKIHLHINTYGNDSFFVVNAIYFLEHLAKSLLIRQSIMDDFEHFINANPKLLLEEKMILIPSPPSSLIMVDKLKFQSTKIEDKVRISFTNPSVMLNVSIKKTLDGSFRLKFGKKEFQSLEPYIYPGWKKKVEEDIFSLLSENK